MFKLAAVVKKFVVGEEGASLVEYSLLVALLAAASIAILYGLGQNIMSMYTQVNTAVGTANVGITSPVSRPGHDDVRRRPSLFLGGPWSAFRPQRCSR